MTLGNILHPVDRAPVRADDPVTSNLAADSVNVPASWRVFAQYALLLGRFTGEQVTRFSDMHDGVYSHSRLRTCMKEWEQYEWLTYEDAHAPTRSGRRARVAVLTDAGIRKARELTRNTSLPNDRETQS